MEEIELGDAFLILDTSTKRHLYIVIAVASENNYLLVNITSSNTQVDPEKDCVINPGEGVPDFVVCRSTVAYAYARELRKNQIYEIIQQGKCRRCGKFSQEQLHRIQERGASSRAIAKKYRDLLVQVLQQRELDQHILREQLRRRLG
jgi:hypothetical protein